MRKMQLPVMVIMLLVAVILLRIPNSILASPNDYPTADTWQFPLDDGSQTPDQDFGWDAWNSYANKGLGGYHLGQDFYRDSRKPVRAAANGWVYYSRTSNDLCQGGYGYVVLIEHRLPDNSHYVSLYGHLEPNTLYPENQAVNKGDIIGYLSTDPCVYGPHIHLHFGIREGSYTLVSPEPGCWNNWPYPGYSQPAGSKSPCYGYTPDRWRRGTDFIRANNLLPQDKFFNVLFSVPGGWPYLFWVSDNTVSKVEIDDSFQFWPNQSGCSAVWYNASQGRHHLKFWYKPGGTGVPTVDIYPWPISIIVPPACAGSPPNPPDPTPVKTDNAAFVTDITLPDGTVVSPGQSLIKTWRMQNTGTSSWGGGYQLVLRDRNPLGAPAVASVPTTSPGQQVDLSISWQIPSNVTPGTYRTSWQLRNAQNTYFGPVIYFSLVVPNVQPPTGNAVNVELVSVNSPSTVSPGQKFQPQVTMRVTSGQLLQSRGDMLRNTDGNLYGAWPQVAAVGTADTGQNYTFTFYTGNPITAPSSEGTYQSKWRVWANNGWVGPEITIQFTVYQAASNRPPNKPSLTSPGDWAVFVGQMSPLCAQQNGDPDGDAVTAYHFEIFQSAQNWDSGWVSNNCVTPSGLGNYGYQWHAQVRDSGGAVSDWSETRHFSIDSTTVTITDFHFDPPSPSNVENVVCYACTSGCAGLNVHLKVLVNTATDGSANGQWVGLKELSVPCFSAQDAPTWPTLDYPDGTHRLRVEATSCDGTIVTREATYTIQRRRPSYPYIMNPSDSFWSNSRTITFRWQAALRANNYTLIVGTTQDPEQVQVLNVPVNGTEYTATFSQDYTRLYWRVYANNEYGRTEQSGRWFGIDRTAPSSSIISIPSLVYENQFVVSWFGNDNASGIQTYDVQVRVQPDGQWQDWLVNYLDASAIFTGQPGRTYDFRTRAHDIAGNVGAFPASPEASVQVDPTKRPPQAWWNTAYTYKRNLVIANRMGSVPLPSGYPVQLHFDSTTTPTAADVYNGSTASIKGNDVRIVYNDQTELARHVINFSSSVIDIWFATEADIAASGSSSAYAMYYSNAGTGTPPTNLGDVYAPHPDAQTAQVWYFEESSGDTPDYSGRNSTITWNGTPIRGTDNGRHGGGVRLTGGQWGQATYNVLVGGNQVTAEAWVWFDALSNTGFPTNQPWMGIVGKPNRWRLTLRDNGTNGFLQADMNIVSNGVEYYERVTSPTAMQTGRWYHVALTYDGSRLHLWVNGVEVGSTGRTGSPRDDGDPIWIGRNNTGDPPLIGRVDGVRVSNVARTSFPYGMITSLPSAAAGQQIGRETIGQTDLVFRNLIATPDPSGGLVVQATIENQGAFQTYNEFFVTLYNRQPTGPGDLNGSIGFWINAPIQAGATITATTLLTNTTGLLKRPVRLGAITETSGTLYGQVDSLGVVTETNKINNISAGIPVCAASADSYENDSAPVNAKTIALGSTQTHNFDMSGDQDWVKFPTQSGVTYTIQTSNLGPNADTYLYLYGMDGSTLLASNDDYGGTLASRIDWQAPASGTYYAMVKQWNPNVDGCGTSYDLTLSLFSGSNKVYLPIVTK